MKLIFENWRRYLKEESINEFTLPFSSQAKMDKELKQLEREMTGEEHVSAWDKIKQEITETKEASGLAMKYFSEGLTEDEKSALWEQIKDIARGTTLAAIFAVPFGSALLPFVLKYTKDVFLPSAFRQNVEVKFPDDIPVEFLEKGDADPEISGFVHPEEDRQRAGIYFNDKLVGFMTPREEPDKGWRIGAIYINPDDRNKRIGSKAINKFFEKRDASSVPIGTDNVASQKAFANAGFALLDPNEILTDEKDGWEYQIWGKK